MKIYQAGLCFKKDSGQIPDVLNGKGYQLEAFSGTLHGNYGLLLQGTINGCPARWFFPKKEALTRAEQQLLQQGLKDPEFAQQMLMPEEPEIQQFTNVILRAASQHFKGVSVISPGGASDYPVAWATPTIIAVDTQANADLLKSLKALDGLRLSKHKDSTCLMLVVPNCPPHLTNQLFIDWLGQEQLNLGKKVFVQQSPEPLVFPKLRRSVVTAPKVDQVDEPATLASQIQDILHTHPDWLESRLSKLKCGIDEWSRMKGDELRLRILPDDLDQIEKRFKPESHRLNAMRWTLRGLPITLAIKKVALQLDEREHFTSRHHAARNLFNG